MALQDDLQTLQNAFDDLYQRLKDAYWGASTAEGKGQIQSSKEMVSKILDALDDEEIHLDTAAMTSLTNDLKTSMKDLADLRTQCDKILNNIAVATSVVSSINAALLIAGKVGNPV